MTSHLVVTSEKSPFCPKIGRIFLQDPRIAKKHWFLGTNARIQSPRRSLHNLTLLANAAASRTSRSVLDILGPTRKKNRHNM